MEVLSTYTGLSIEEMLENSSTIINVLDMQHRILFWNKAAENYFKIPKETALGKKLEELLPGIEKNESMINLKRAFAGYSLVLYNQPYSFKRGKYSQRLIPIKDNNKKVICVLNIVEDM